MRYPASGKLESIRTVETSHLPTKQTLRMLGIPSSTYYDCYARWLAGGVDALADRSPRPRSVWNRIPDDVREAFVEFALDHEDLTPRELAVKYTNEIVHDYANFGTWTKRGSVDTSACATAVWKKILEEDKRPDVDPDKVAALHAYTAKRTAAGGTPPES
jgi:hypothetical protein